MAPHCLALHLPRHEQGFTEELNGTGASVGDAGGADEQLQGVLGLLVGVDEDVGLLAQVFDLSVESGDAMLQIRSPNQVLGEQGRYHSLRLKRRMAGNSGRGHTESMYHLELSANSTVPPQVNSISTSTATTVPSRSFFAT